jgi:hypothetical protein
MIKPRVNLRRVFIFTAIAALIIIYTALWVRMISSPTERTGTDFIHFYAAGQIAQRWGSDKVYKLDLQKTIEEEQVGFSLASAQILPYNHMPYLIPALWLITSENYVASFYRWVFLMLVALALSIWILFGLIQSANPIRTPWLVSTGTFLFFPFFVSLLIGQDSALLVLGAALWMYGISRDDDRLAGLGLSLTTIRPHLALVMAIPFLFRRQRVFAWFLIGGSLLGLVSIVTLGYQGVLDFIQMMLVSASGRWYGIKPEGMFNLIGLLERATPIDSNIIRILGWGVYAVGTVILSIFWRRSSDIQIKHIGIMTTVALFIAPHLYYHDLSLMIIPIFAVMQTGIQTKQFNFWQISILPLLLGYAMFLSEFIPAAEYSVSYLVMLFLIIYLLVPQTINRLIFRNLPDPR